MLVNLLFEIGKGPSAVVVVLPEAHQPIGEVWYLQADRLVFPRQGVFRCGMEFESLRCKEQKLYDTWKCNTGCHTPMINFVLGHNWR